MCLYTRHRFETFRYRQRTKGGRIISLINLNRLNEQCNSFDQAGIPRTARVRIRIRIRIIVPIVPSVSIARPFPFRHLNLARKQILSLQESKVLAVGERERNLGPKENDRHQGSQVQGLWGRQGRCKECQKQSLWWKRISLPTGKDGEDPGICAPSYWEILVKIEIAMAS